MNGPDNKDRTAGTARTSAEAVVQVVIMLAIGAAAGAASFTHVRAVAAAHGQGGWLAWADAVVLELMSIASGLELRRRRRQHHSVVFPAVVLVCAVALSLAAQVVQAEASVIGWIAAALPALGFLTMVKIALAQTTTTPAADGVRDRPGQPLAVPDHVDDVDHGGDQSGSGPDLPAQGHNSGLSAVRGLRASGTADSAVPDDPDDRRDDGDGRRDGPEKADDAGDDGDGAIPELVGSDVAALLTAARTARDTLALAGEALSRDSLARQMRRDGHGVSNAKASAVFTALKAQPLPPTVDLRNGPAARDRPLDDRVMSNSA